MTGTTQAVGAATVESKPSTLKELEEFYDQVVKHNDEIKAQIAVLESFRDGLQGVGPPSTSDSPPDDEPNGALGHIRFALTEQARLLEVLGSVTAKL